MEKPLRPSRAGFALYKHPKAHLAIYYAVHVLHADKRWPDQLQLIVKHRPDIAESYKAQTGRELTANVVANRVDKAHRQSEWKNYSTLLPQAVAEVQKWRDRLPSRTAAARGR
jgi:hypothetical protein